MISTLMVSREKSFFAEIESELAENNIKSDWSGTGTKTLSALLDKNIDLLIIEENLPDMNGRQLVEKVIMEHPMINCVVASSRSHKEFHEAYEGFGVLMQFSLVPGKKEAQQLIEHMEHIFNLHGEKNS